MPAPSSGANPAGPKPDARSTPAASDRPLAERLANVSGMDTALGLAHTGGRAALLERVLLGFIAQYGDGDADLAAPGGGDPVPAWRAASHSLRGACATIGATALQASLAAFEAALASPTDQPALAAQAAALDAALRRLVADLKAALAR